MLLATMLVAKNFLRTLFLRNSLVLIWVTITKNEEGITVKSFQLSIARGGLIICLALQYSACNGPGCDGFLITSAENISAAAKGGKVLSERKRCSIHGTLVSYVSRGTARLADVENKFKFMRGRGGPRSRH